MLGTTNWQAANGGNCPAPLPCNAPFGETIAYSVPSDSGAGAPQNTYSTVARVDYNFSDKTTLYGRYALTAKTTLLVTSTPALMLAMTPARPTSTRA